MITFKDLLLSEPVQKALDALEFTTPTEIQKKAIPVLLQPERVDLLGQAQTGTGKTFAFGIPLVHKINPASRDVQALIVAPTRELVCQIRDSLRQLTKFMPEISIEAIYGGVSMPEQIRALKKGVHIVVGTPGRLNDHLNRRTLHFKSLNTLVLDEADTMLDMGFKDEVDEIMRQTPEERQIWLFSATIKPGINDLMKSHMKNTVSILVSKSEVTTSTTKQYYCMAPRSSRLDALCRLIDNAPEFYGFIFCQTKVLTAEVSEKLAQRGYKVNALHGDMSQAQRNTVIKKFKKQEFSILVATDVAARGIDVSDATHVINYSLPDDQESYVHRIGRTGRAGKEGIAITMVTQSDVRRLRFIAQKFKFELHPLEIPRIETIAVTQQAKALTVFKHGSEKLHASDKFIAALHTTISQHSKDELVNMVTNTLYDTYIKNMIPAQEISMPTYDMSDESNGSNGNGQGLQEYFISIGGDDGIEKTDILNYLTSTGKLTRTDIKKIKLLNKHTFAVVPETKAQEAMESLIGQSINGRRVRISITNEVPDMSGFGGNSSNRGGGDRGGFSRGGDRGGFSRDRGGRGNFRESRPRYESARSN